jgi:hypothetical protein
LHTVCCRSDAVDRYVGPPFMPSWQVSRGGRAPWEISLSSRRNCAGRCGLLPSSRHRRGSCRRQASWLARIRSSWQAISNVDPACYASQSGDLADGPVSIRAGDAWIGGRVCAIRKSQEAIHRAQRRLTPLLLPIGANRMETIAAESASHQVRPCGKTTLAFRKVGLFYQSSLPAM